MAELETVSTKCCSPAAQESCCEPYAKAECCGDSAGTCGCSEDREGSEAGVRESVRERYAAAAVAASKGSAACCGDAR